MMQRFNSHTNGRTFIVEMLGNNRSLTMIVSSLMKLINLKDKNYVLSTGGGSKADILFADSDDKQAMMQVQARRRNNSKLPVIVTSSQENKALGSNFYYLPKRKLGSQLLKMLDEITVKHLNCAPSLVISEKVALRPQSNKSVLKVLPNEQINTRNKGKVLVIDDSLAVRTQMKIFLQMYSLDVDLVDNAERGIELANTIKYDLIFLDIVLPEMNGYKACKLLKVAPASAATPVVMLTGKSSKFNKLRGVMAGCDQYLTKPVNGTQLQSVLKEYLPILKTKNK